MLIFITNCGSFHNYYKLRQKLLQITAGIINFGVITNCVVTMVSQKPMLNIGKGGDDLLYFFRRRNTAHFVDDCRIFIISYKYRSARFTGNN